MKQNNSVIFNGVISIFFFRVNLSETALKTPNKVSVARSLYFNLEFPSKKNKM